MHHPQTGGYSTFNEAVAAQRARTESTDHAPAHGGYPGSITPNPLHTTDAALGRSRMTCPDCRPRYICPFHRAH